MKPGSKGWKLFMSKLYGFGAAIVIFGAMFKIQHWPGASAMLVLGLSVEALIFIFSDAYERASVSISGLTAEAAEGESFGEQMQKVSKNLSALNNVYELQLKGSSAHLEATEKFQSQVTDMMANLSASVEDTRLYKENMALLSQNLTDLNNVYGNMLKAMTITKG